MERSSVRDDEIQTESAVPDGDSTGMGRRALQFTGGGFSDVPGGTGAVVVCRVRGENEFPVSPLE